MTETAATVLIVEDDDRVRRELVLIVAELGAVTEAGSLSEAEQLLGTQSYHLILIDLALPDGSGLDLFSAVHALDEPPAVVVVSSTLNIVARNECLARGAADFISKPFHAEELSRRLERVVASHRRARELGTSGLEVLFSESQRSRLSRRERGALETLAARPLVPMELSELARTIGVTGVARDYRIRRVLRRLRRVLETEPRDPQLIVHPGGSSASASSRVMFVPPRGR